MTELQKQGKIKNKILKSPIFKGQGDFTMRIFWAKNVAISTMCEYSDITHFSSIESALSYVRKYTNGKMRFFHLNEKIYIKVTEPIEHMVCSDGYEFDSQSIKMYRVK